MRDYRDRYDHITRCFMEYRWVHLVLNTEVAVTGVLVSRSQHVLPNVHVRTYLLREPVALAGFKQVCYFVNLNDDQQVFPMFGELIYDKSVEIAERNSLSRDLNEVILKRIRSGEIQYGL